MEQYIQISLLNDFIFCPRSIYFHQLYGSLSTKNYHTTYQVNGLNAHKSIDNQSYSSKKSILQSIDIYSAKYNLLGKIDLLDRDNKILIERKNKIQTIYDGYILQLYAQYFCLVEMGYEVTMLKLYSISDNKSYPIDLPENNPALFQKFEKTVQELAHFNLHSQFVANPQKCQSCIYNNLCDYYQER